MAKTLIVQLTCDRCKAEKGDNVDGAETVAFGFDGFDYSIDLCTEHALDFHNTVQGLIGWSSDRARSGAGRRARRSSGGGGDAVGATPARSSSDRERLKAIRDWARKNGYPNLGDRGRIPQAIVAEFDAAH
ncbi:MAG: histone-like nucleoid-structuring protein Lsr2 [Acidimicrobiales bacterium]